MSRKMKAFAYLRRPIVSLSIAIIVALVLIPLIAGTYTLYVMFLIFMSITMSEGWNVITGYAGKVCFGNVAFFGVGAYAFAILWNQGLNPFISLVLGGLIASVYSLVIGLPTLRLRGPYFAISTLALMLATSVIARYWKGLTGGAEGMLLPVRTGILEGRVVEYYTMMCIALISILISYKVKYSKFGTGLAAIRDDEDAAEMIGVDTTIHKTLAFAIDAFLTGMAGAMYAFSLPYIDPSILFSFPRNVENVLMPMLGGMGTVFGPVTGAITLVLLKQFTLLHLIRIHPAFLHFHLIIYGLMIILVVLFMRGGIMGALEKYLLPRVFRIVKAKGGK
ncbi:MAG: branched-chain amino acid ABC transporter permease [Candidatus Freyarchaeota archaeon]